MFTQLRQEARDPTRLQAEYGGGRDTERQAERTGDTQGRLGSTGYIVADPRAGGLRLYPFAYGRLGYRIVDFLVGFKHIGKNGEFHGILVPGRRPVDYEWQKLLHTVQRIFVLRFCNVHIVQFR